MGFATPSFRLAVTGGRRYTNRFKVYGDLDRVLAKRGRIVLIHGNGTGADALAKEWAISRRMPHIAFPADWDGLGKAAGPRRNQQMVDSGLDGCVAFPGNRGTADMVARCKKAGVPVWHRD